MQKKAALRKNLLRLRLDGILITDIVNLRYLTGFTGSSGFLIIIQKQAVFVTDSRYQEQSRQEVKGFKIRIEDNERTKEIKELCDMYGIRKLGFEDHNITYKFHKKLLSRKIKLKALTETVELLRAIKSDRELSCIRTAVKRAERAFKKLLPFIKTGTTERRLSLKLESLLKDEGCEKLPFGVIAASGSMSALPHAKPANRVLKAGDFLLFDWGGECKGFFSDMTRTLLLKGRNISRQKELYSVVLEAQLRAVKAVKSGIRASVIDAAARDYLKQKGYEDYFGHGTGHGVGLAIHEKPVVSWRSKDRIEKGMVFTIEPGVYIPGFGGVRIEDMVVVRKNRAELLTALPRRLKII